MKTFEPNKTTEELGIDVSRKFKVVNGDEYFDEGDVLIFTRGNDTCCPSFVNQNGKSFCFYWYDLVYADEDFTKGEVVEVRDDEDDEWEDSIYLETIEGAKSPFICVGLYDEVLFNNGEDGFGIVNWKYIRRINTSDSTNVSEYTLEELQEKLGENIKIVTKKVGK